MLLHYINKKLTKMLPDEHSFKLFSCLKMSLKEEINISLKSCNVLYLHFIYIAIIWFRPSVFLSCLFFSYRFAFSARDLSSLRIWFWVLCWYMIRCWKFHLNHLCNLLFDSKMMCVVLFSAIKPQPSFQKSYILLSIQIMTLLTY